VKSPLEHLIEAPEEINPALEMVWELKRLELEGKRVDVHMLIQRAEAIEDAQHVGRALVTLGDAALKQLKSASAQTSSLLPTGF
jgi:hypothetical protein